MQFLSRLSLTLFTTALLILTGCTTTASVDEASSSASVDDVAKGREQMVRAFDAAWVRVMASGKQQEILNSEPPNDPGLANSYVVRMADCLPLPDLTPYPENPTGLLQKVLDAGEIRMLTQDVPNTPADSSYFFSTLSERYFQAILDELGNHYGVTITRTNVAAVPGRLASTSYLLNDEVDAVSQLNATGGRTQNLRRRISRRYTCTLAASTQFIHIPENSELVSEINSLHDLMDRPEVRICAGPLTTQTAKAFMPNHKVTTRYISDIAECDQRVKAGKADIIINPIPDLNMSGIDGYKSVHTLIVAGTPLWVAMEGIACDIAPARGKGEPECREIDPL
jgi:ABC-type amino acid transport substrate-binding protein